MSTTTRSERQATRRVMRAKAAVLAEVGKRVRVAGTVQCPNCGGTLFYRIGPDGEMTLACDTRGCCAWTEK